MPARHGRTSPAADLRWHRSAAEPLARRAIEIRSGARSGAVASGDPALLLDRGAHAAILDGLGRSDEAEAVIRDLLTGLEAALGPDHPEVAVALNNLAAIVQRRGALEEAEGLYRRVVAIKEARLGADAPALAAPLNNLGTVLRAAGRLDEAVPGLKTAVHGSTSATSASPRVSACTSFACLPAEPRKMRGFIPRRLLGSLHR